MTVCLTEPVVRPPHQIPEHRIPEHRIPEHRIPEPRTSRRSVLAVARAIVERGWLQHDWCTDNRPSRLARLVAGPPRPDEVDQACLVAALTIAAHRGGRLVNVERDAMPWIAHVWRCLPGSAGRSAPALRGPQGAALIRDLTRWNDAPHRTQGEVVALLERAERLAPVG